MRAGVLRTLAAAGLLVALAGCGEDTVSLAVRPAAGDTAEYRITVRATTVTTIGDGEPRRRTSSVVLRARQRVLASSPKGSRVEVRLDPGGDRDTTFVVLLDASAQLEEVQQVEGVPAEALGGLGVSDLLPVAAAAPPARPVAPGDRWSIDGPVVAGSTRSRLRGTGRLASLGVANGRRLAFVDSTYALPVERTTDEGGAPVQLHGRLRTTATAAYDLDGDRVQWVRATTSGRYDLTLLPPAGAGGLPVAGTLRVDVSSFSDRVE